MVEQTDDGEHSRCGVAVFWVAESKHNPTISCEHQVYFGVCSASCFALWVPCKVQRWTSAYRLLIIVTNLLPDPYLQSLPPHVPWFATHYTTTCCVVYPFILICRWLIFSFLIPFFSAPSTLLLNPLSFLSGGCQSVSTSVSGAGYIASDGTFLTPSVISTYTNIPSGSPALYEPNQSCEWIVTPHQGKGNSFAPLSLSFPNRTILPLSGNKKITNFLIYPPAHASNTLSQWHFNDTPLHYNSAPVS